MYFTNYYIGKILSIIDHLDISKITQSICNHFKKIESKTWGEKNRVRILFVIQKEKRQPGFFSFKLQAKNMIQTLDAASSIFFKNSDPKTISGRPDKLDIRVQIDWVISIDSGPIMENRASPKRCFYTLQSRTGSVQGQNRVFPV